MERDPVGRFGVLEVAAVNGQPVLEFAQLEFESGSDSEKLVYTQDEDHGHIYELVMRR